jgi:hypothetical protein
MTSYRASQEQQLIDDAVPHVVAEQQADATQVCIVGWVDI